MKRFFFATAAAVFAVGAVAFSSRAQAQCWWNGVSYACAAPPAAAYYPPAYYAPAYNTYPTLSFAPFGQKPQWLPSYPGPRPSAGAGW